MPRRREGTTIEAYICDWINLILRWTHVVAGIAWIGSSFHFFWLDTRLNVPPRDPEHAAVAGDLWAVHGGGFYHVQKYTVVPGSLPEPLHWFKWEAYATWITGFLLLAALYYAHPQVYLIDRHVADISGAAAVGSSLALLALGWFIYDVLCRSLADERLIGAIGSLFVTALAFVLTHLFGGRGAFVQMGAVLGTIMVANVFLVIIPSQRELVTAKRRGERSDARLGARARQRSMHNNYLTLPVLFAMISHHYPVTFAHRYSWAVLTALFAVGVLVRHYFNLRNRGRNVVIVPISAVAILVAVAFASVPAGLDERRGSAATTPEGVGFGRVRAIVEARCTACHSSKPRHPTVPVAPNGVRLDTDDAIRAWAGRIYERVAITRTMPLANLTGMTEVERDTIARWYRDGATLE